MIDKEKRDPESLKDKLTSDLEDVKDELRSMSRKQREMALELYIDGLGIEVSVKEYALFLKLFDEIIGG